MAQPSLNFKVDTKALLAYSNRIKSAARVTSVAAAGGLNHVGDGLVSSLSVSLAKQTSLSLEQVRALLKVKRATRNDLHYEISVSNDLLSEGKSRTLEGKREKNEFGKYEPGQLVIVVSKKDELVCMDCEELDAAGPMPIEVAMRHVPRHPNCRCVIMPYVSKKRLPVTMTTISGTSSSKRAGNVARSLDQNATLRQLAQEILNRSSRAVRLELK
jgi:hypothetical protein